MILQRGAGSLTKIVLANAITPYEYGIITMVVISLPGMFQLATNLNFYYILSHAEEGKKYFGFTLLYSFVITLLLSVLLLLFSGNIFGYINLPLDKWELLYAAVIISLFPLSILVDFQGLLAGLRNYSLPGIIMTLPSVSRLGLMIYLIYFKIISFEIIILFFSFSNAIPLVFLLLSRRFRDYFSLARSINIPSKKIFAFGASLFIVSSFSTIGQYLIKVVVSHELGIIWQGYYDISLTLASLMMFALGTMSFVSIPEATNSNKNGIYEKGGLGDVARGLFSMSVFLLIVLIFYSKYITIKLFSEDYVMASEYVAILAVSYIFLFIQLFLANMDLSFAKNAKDYLSLTLITLFLLPMFMFLTGFLIEFFKNNGYGNGFIGAYLSYTILIILYTSLTIYYARDLTPLKILLHRIDKLAVSFIITFLLLYYLDLPALPGIFISAVLFTALVFISGYLNKSLFLDMFKSGKT
ncbi:MAG TPA: hypothetical protein VIO11_01040 [Candidatus Methanoperedens sp.]